LTPGLTDAHLHLLEWACARRRVDLADAASPTDAAARVARRAADSVAGDWVVGGGWNPHRWAARPTRGPLDRAVPDRPVALRSHDMHAWWVNGEALARAGIGPDSPDPPGGRIVRDPVTGEPTGELLEEAGRLVAERIPKPEDARLEAAVLEAQAELHRQGVTGVHSIEMPGDSFDSLRVLTALHGEGRLRLRVLQHLPLGTLESAVRLGLRSGMGDARLRIGAVKIFLDGALGSRTAWLREPYEGEGAGGDRGVRLLDDDAFDHAVRRAAAVGIASAVHAIGDAAVALAIDTLGAAPRVGALPHRIEHVQLCPVERVGEIAAAGLACSMQPAHLMTDWRAAERHWGRARCRGAYAFRTLRRAAPDAILAFGSDSPVEPVDPRLGLYAATARRDLDGEPDGGWYPDERLSPAEALEAYTVGPARAGGAAGRRGRLAAGFDADIAAWSRDPLSRRRRDDWLELGCMATMVAGEWVWRDRE
ncbi:MAG: amidohydrolase, partial [Gemmatimonadota bacterium]